MSIINLLARRASMSRMQGRSLLPEGYTQKKWLISNNYYVSLGLSMVYFTFDTTIKWNSSTTHNGQYFGNNNALFGINASAGWRSNGMGGTTSYPELGTANTTDTYVSSFKRTRTLVTWTVNGVTVTKSVSSAAAGDIYLFNIKNDSTYRCNCQIGETKIYDDSDVLVSHLIPCTDSDNNSGVYDVVRNQFFTKSNFTSE